MFLLFFLAWVIFNGRITMEIVIFGLVIAAAVLAFVCKFMDYSIEKEKKFYGKFLFLIKYPFSPLLINSLAPSAELNATQGTPWDIASIKTIPNDSV